MLIKYILSYAIGLLIVYFCNDGIADLLSGKQAIIRFIELTIAADDVTLSPDLLK